MSIYIEKIPKRSWWMFQVLVFCLLYLPNLGTRELRPEEALTATVAEEMAASGHYLATTVHGEPVRAFPLDAWAIAVLRRALPRSTATARLPFALAILGMAGLAGYVAARAAGHLAGAAAAAMVLTAPVCLDAGTRAGSNAVFAFLISAAWFAWYRLGRIEKHWGAAWITALLLTTLAAFGAGMQAFLYFYFPLLFLRRPLRFSVRMRVWGHVIGLAAAALVIGLWLWNTPNQIFFPWKSLVVGSIPQSSGGYLRDLFTFPFVAALYLFPWIFLLWPGFCAAFRPLEKTPVLCRYLRVLAIPLFLATWVLPALSFRVLLPIVPALAVLTGIHYEILVRRYFRQLSRLQILLARVTAIAAAAALALLLLHLLHIIRFVQLSAPAAFFDAALLLAAFLLARELWRPQENGAFWRRLTLALLALRLVYLAVLPTGQALFRNRAFRFAQRLESGLPPADKTPLVYKYVHRLLVTECFYLHRPVVRIRNIAEVPAPQRTHSLYVIGGPKYPLLDLNNRTWKPCSPPVDLRSRLRLKLESGNWHDGLLRVEAELRPPARPAPDSVIRMYRGDLLPADQRVPATPPATPAGAGPSGPGPGAASNPP